MRGRSAALLTFAFAVAVGAILNARARGMFETDRDASQQTSIANPVHETGAAAAEQRGNPLWAVPLGVLSETGARPIFSLSRRPPAPAAVTVATAPPPPEAAKPVAPERPLLQLVGTVSGGALHLGLFLDETTQKPTRLSVSESHKGWVLRDVSATEARLQSAERTAILPLRVQRKARPKGGATSSEIAGTEFPVRHRRR